VSDRLDVWIAGRHAGILERSHADGRLTFAYTESYRHTRGATPLSLSMPLHATTHRGDTVHRWFDNLLPDDDEVRERWAASLGTRPGPFNLLAGMGIDCAGAVQVVPAGSVPEQTGDHLPLGVPDIEKRLSTLRADGASWNDDGHGGQWSLGGAQGKFALARQNDGTWTAPTGRAASTHIFKVGVVRFANGDIAEFVSTRAAKHLGLDAARVDVMQFGQQTALVVERYDRMVQESRTVRVHQEDLCQALGVSRHLKYQNDGGPSVSQIAALIGRLRPIEAARSRELFARALVYNFLTVSPDAHAKNYSLLLAGPRARLAPLYDLTSGALLLDPDQVFFRGKSAMKIGGDYRFRSIGRADWAKCAADLGVEFDWLMTIAEEYRDAIPNAFEEATDEAVAAGGDLIPPGTKDRYMRGIMTALGHVTTQMGLATAVSPLPVASSQATPNRSGNQTPIDAFDV
jgi:serine/threonine-protein kinase HipA